jgi:hypothetical protein
MSDDLTTAVLRASQRRVKEMEAACRAALSIIAEPKAPETKDEAEAFMARAEAVTRLLRSTLANN